jgi:D-sedoheptulose 7-phosphate isomerase
VEAYFQKLSATIPHLPLASINQIIQELIQAFEKGRTLFVFGNGGSAAIASHLACDLTKGTFRRWQGQRVKVMALTDNVPALTAWANDAGYEHVFSGQLKSFARPGDVALAISGSGSSPNIVLALQAARASGCVTLGLAGNQGGRMKALCDACAVIPSDDMQIIEDLMQATAHSIFVSICAAGMAQPIMFPAEKEPLSDQQPS